MRKAELKNFGNADEVREFPKGQLELIKNLRRKIMKLDCVVRSWALSLPVALLLSIPSLSEAAVTLTTPQTYSNLIWVGTWIVSPTDQNWLTTCSGTPTLNLDLTMAAGSAADSQNGMMQNGMMYGLVLCTGTMHFSPGVARVSPVSADFELNQSGRWRWNCQLPSLTTSLNGSCSIISHTGESIGTLNLTFQP